MMATARPNTIRTAAAAKPPREMSLGTYASPKDMGRRRLDAAALHLDLAIVGPSPWCRQGVRILMAGVCSPFRNQGRERAVRGPRQAESEWSSRRPVEHPACDSSTTAWG